MTYKLFIDDERFPVTDDFVIVRDSQSAIEIIKSKGNPSFISFDHDLGGEDTSMRFIKAWAELILDGKLPVITRSNFEYYVHSQNPIGAKNIKSYMESILDVFS